MYYKCFFIIFFLLNFTVSFAQSALDSLYKVYLFQSGEQQIQTGLLLCDNLEDNPKQMLQFALELQKKVVNYDRISVIKAKVLKKVSDAWFYNDSLEKSNELLLQSLAVIEINHPEEEAFLAELYNDLGLNYNELEKFSSAEYYFSKALPLFKKLHLDQNTADVINNLGGMYHDKGNYEKALFMFLEAYELDKRSGNKKAQSTSLNNIGQMYVKLGKYDMGLEKYTQSLDLLKIDDLSAKAVRYNNMGMVYQLKGQHKTAIQWFEKALQIDLQEKNGLKIGIRKHNMAISYMAIGMFPKAEQLLKEAAESFIYTQTNSRLSTVYMSLGELYEKQKKAKQAEDFFNKALLYALKSEDLKVKQDAYGKLYQFYKSKGDADKALLFYEKQNIAKDSIFTLKLLKNIEEIQAHYETIKKDEKIQMLSEENKLKSELLNYRKRERNIAVLGFLITLFFMFGLYHMFSTVKSQRWELARQNTELDKLNKTQNQLFGIISHDLKNAFASYKSYIKLIEYHLSKNTPEKLTPLLPDLQAHSNRLSTLLDNLLHWSVMQIKGIQPEFEQIELQEEFIGLMEIFKIKASEKNITLDMIADKKTVYCDKESLRLILRNLIDNAIKYTEKGSISLYADTRQKQTIITITDTGIGIPTEVQNILFTMDKQKIRMGTKGEKGTGLGLTLVVEHLEKNHGTLEVVKSDSKGTTLMLSLKSAEK